MSKFMDVHSGFFGVTAEQLAVAHQADLDIEGSEGVHFQQAWLDPEAGKVSKHYVADAVKALLAGSEVETKETKAFGCGISRVKK